MPTTEQMLRRYPTLILEVIGELRNAFLEAAESPEELVELLAAQITDPASVQSAYEEAAEESLEAQRALEALLRNGGELAATQFVRQFGNVRQMGEAKLEREMPWLQPESVAERLYYLGLIGVGFAGEGPSAKSIMFVPSDILPWLPAPRDPGQESELSVRPVGPPKASRLLLAEDSFLEDAGSLLGFLHSDRLRLTSEGEANEEDLNRFAQRLQHSFERSTATDVADSETADLSTRLELLLHLANRLGWLRLGENGGGRVIELTGNRVRAFLDATRAEQRRLLWDAWRQSKEWNDLCRTPELECTHRNNWINDPLQTRSVILQMLSRLEPGAWYSQAELIQSIQETEPDFQRPTGEYETWYIRDTNTHEYFKGFEQWDAVEGALLRFYLRGPLYWLQAMDLAETSAGDDALISLSQWGAHWLLEDAPQPHEAAWQPIEVAADFTVTAPYGTPLSDRFRVERFANWRSSEMAYVYQISQRSLQRAQEEGIGAGRVLAFLREKTRAMPQNVEKALVRYSENESA
jgi:hypothetical protein